MKEDEKLLGIASLRKWAAEDDPRGYDKLCIHSIDAQRPAAKIGYYDDVIKLTHNNPTVEEVEEWMRSCIYKIMDGGNSYYMAGNRVARGSVLTHHFAVVKATT